ncbi:MAG: preprotein translocase subunit YajC [Flavobacteriales bacterium]|jgi:preprotein translocase subunit YajC
MRHFKANRERLDDFMSKDKVASFLQGLAVLILVIWIVIFYFSPEDKRNQLTQEMQESFKQLKAGVSN